MKRKNKFVFIATTVISVAMTGCVSIEDQLNSQDPNVRVQGEYRLLTNARLSGKPEEVVSAINRIQIKSVLLEIAKDALYEKMSDSVKESINAASATQEATASNKPSVKVSVVMKFIEEWMRVRHQWWVVE